MECDRAHEAISARIDGEDAAVPGGALDAHLAGCAACRTWQQRAHAVTRRARLGGSFLSQDLTPRVLAATAAAPAGPLAPAGRYRWLAQRGGLAIMALAQLAITAPLLILGHDQDAGMHAAQELGSFDLALAIAFAVGAIRPALSAGLAWPCGIAAAGLVGTAVADLIGGAAIGAGEAQHLIAVAGAVLLCWQARTAGPRHPRPAITAWQTKAGTSPAAGHRAVVPVEAAPDPRLPGRGPARIGHGTVA